MLKHIDPGARWMLLASLLFGCMGVFVKLAAAYFSATELVFYRSFFGLLLVYIVLRQQGLSLQTPHKTQHLWRSVSGTAALALFFYCITVLPLATAVTLNYTAPLFLAAFLLTQRHHPGLTAAIVLGFIGVVLLLQPTLTRNQIIPGLLGLTSGFLAGIAYLNIKQLGQLNEPDSRIVFYFSLFASLCSGIIMLFDHIHSITPYTSLLLICMGSCATLAQLCMTRAYCVGNTLVVGSFAYCTIIVASLFDLWLWHEDLSPISWLGMLLIITGGVLSLYLSGNTHHQQPNHRKDTS